MKRTSLTLRVVVLASLWLTTALGAVGFAVLQVFEASALRQFDSRLEAELVLLAVAVSRSPDDPSVRMTSPDFARVYSGLYWQAERLPPGGDTTELYGSRSLWDHRFVHKKPDSGILRGTLRGPDAQSVRALCQRVRGLDGSVWDLVVAADHATLAEELRQVREGLIRSGILLAVLLVAAAFLLIRMALNPLRQLRSTVQEIHRSDCEHLPGAFPAEVAPLVDDLNAVLSKNRRMRERGRVQAANLAHALKTPAAVLQNEIDRARQGNELDLDLATQSVTRISDAASRHLSVLSAGVEDIPEHESHDAVPLLAGIVQAVQRLFQDKVFALSTPPAFPLGVNPADQQEIFGNLIENAGKWAAKDVAIGFRLDALQAVLTVDDDGPGIPEDARARIVGPGVRLDETRSGSGLGLSIVSDLVAQYGGQLAFETGPLGGLRATVRLPVRVQKA
ncbi:MAG: HAMP domain-containing sensor histidine kinase [Pseudomonadota bacterium]